MHTKFSCAALASVALAVFPPVASTVYAAPPPGFPNLNDDAPADARSHVFFTRGSKFVALYPPSKHYHCLINVTGKSWDQAHAPSCVGDIPGADEAPAEGPIPDGCFQVSISPDSLSRFHAVCGPFSNRTLEEPDYELSPGQKITVGPITCAQGEGDNTACLDARGGGHGFVISPERSWTF
jgi:hypothetical protein